MGQAMGAMVGGGERQSEVADTSQIRGSGLHKADFIARRTARLKDVYVMSKQLGEGSFGVVHLVTHRMTGQQAVCKVINKLKCKDHGLVRNEIELLKTLDHPNIIRVFEYFEDETAFMIICECIYGGDLQEELATLGSNEVLTEATVAKYLRQLLLATNYCHSLDPPVIHRDIKPGNVMKVSRTAGKSDIKVIDFGLASLTKVPISDVCGTPMFMAPEVFRANYGKQSDIWSIGIMFYYLLTNEMPFPKNFRPRGMEEFSAMVQRLYPPFPDEQGWNRKSMSRAQNLVLAMLKHDPAQRWTAAECLRHEWLLKKCPAESFGWIGRMPGNQITADPLIRGFAGYAQSPAVLRALCLMSASQISQDDLGKMKRHFAAIDVDGDGYINSLEMADFMNRRKKKAGENGNASEVAMQMADLDGDGIMGFTEFAAVWLYSKMGKDHDFLKHAFDLFDRDCDGFVQQKDVVRVLDTPQMGEIAEHDQFLQEITGMFPANQKMDFPAFAGKVMTYEPVLLGLQMQDGGGRSWMDVLTCRGQRRDNESEADSSGDESEGPQPMPRASVAPLNGPRTRQVVVQQAFE